jgi:hypothetical protein
MEGVPSHHAVQGYNRREIFEIIRANETRHSNFGDAY